MSRKITISCVGVCLIAACAVGRISMGVQEFDQWKGFGVGSWSKYESTFMQEGKSFTKVETFTLAAIEEKKLSVKVEDVKAEEGKTSTSKRTVFLSPQPEATGGSELKIEEGDEQLKVGDQTLDCHWTKQTTQRKTRDGAEMSSVYTVWLCPKVPGQVVKTTLRATMGDKVTADNSSVLSSFEAK